MLSCCDQCGNICEEDEICCQECKEKFRKLCEAEYGPDEGESSKFELEE